MEILDLNKGSGIKAVIEVSKANIEKINNFYNWDNKQKVLNHLEDDVLNYLEENDLGAGETKKEQIIFATEQGGITGDDYEQLVLEVEYRENNGEVTVII